MDSADDFGQGQIVPMDTAHRMSHKNGRLTLWHMENVPCIFVTSESDDHTKTFQEELSAARTR
eukprot:jgi/Botrbrau1/19345/Bobra.0073s0070.1